MEVHGSRRSGRRQEVRCPDCGQRYLIAEGQLSARCTGCGNIVAVNTGAPVAPPTLETSPNPLAAFADPPDGQRVQEIISRFQVEWQLWAELVRNFADPHYHSAYISQALAKNLLPHASERYREHRSVMALLADDRWQADVSDLMLARLERLSLVRLQQAESVGPWYRLLAEVNAEPLRRRLLKFTWIVVGMGLALRALLAWR